MNYENKKIDEFNLRQTTVFCCKGKGVSDGAGDGCDGGFGLEAGNQV